MSGPLSKWTKLDKGYSLSLSQAQAIFGSIGLAQILRSAMTIELCK